MSDALRVLVVDDEPAIRRLLQRLLERLGHDALFALTGCEAVERALEGDVDVVLMDIHLPELDGIEATREIVASRDGDHPRIIGFSAAASEDEQQRGLEAGMTVVLAKTLLRHHLADLLHRHPRRV